MDCHEKAPLEAHAPESLEEQQERPGSYNKAP